MKRGALNLQAALEVICLAAFSAVLLYLALSGAYLYYVAPRVKPYLFFSAGALLVCAMFSATRLFRPQYRRRSAHCFLLAIPVLLVLLPHEQISTVSSGGLLTGGSAFGGADNQTPAISSPLSPSSPGSSESSVEDGIYTMEGASGQVIGYLHGYDPEARTVTVPDSEFYNWCSELFLYPDRFEGFEITMTGFVLKDIPSLNADEFVPARLMMSCCAADLSPCGIVCKYDNVSALAADSWITVTGTLQVGSFEGAPEPQIHVSSIEPAEEITDYVYPY
ncbi:TIGR03943 family putative permease subunit [Oscillibacter sp.]|uniref:TIGR03943 family putative permease subunit n=1 Tax=Oscillibacter sp. TaxID=1945593 RepID=UPI0028AD7230|nr:TIGR03943 family protein [Oscillibacter sp.]